MGVMKQWELEEAEREYNERMARLKPAADRLGMDPETYEAFMEALEKDD